MSRYGCIETVGSRQAGRISWAQLRLLHLTEAKILTRVQRGDLIPVLPRVYAVGHLAPSRAAQLWEAILYAGPGAMLSHATAAHHRGLINFPPRAIHVSTPRSIASLPAVEPSPELPPGAYLHPEIVVHARRSSLTREIHDGLAVTDLAATVVDLAAARPDLLQHALGALDFQEILDPVALRAGAGTGKLGTRALGQALDRYDPNWVKLDSPAEVDFYAFCQEWDVTPLPEPNFQLTEDIRVDGYWREEKVVAEVDGGQNHHSHAQRLRDRNRDMTCRRLDLSVVRYVPVQFRTDPAGVYADLIRVLRRR